MGGEMIEASLLVGALVITAIFEAIWIWMDKYEIGMLEKTLEQKEQELKRYKLELKSARGWKE